MKVVPNEGGTKCYLAFSSSFFLFFDQYPVWPPLLSITDNYSTSRRPYIKRLHR